MKSSSLKANVVFHGADAERLQARMKALGYGKVATFLRDAALGNLDRDAADGLTGVRHDFIEFANELMAATEDVKERTRIHTLASMLDEALVRAGARDAD